MSLTGKGVHDRLPSTLDVFLENPNRESLAVIAQVLPAKWRRLAERFGLSYTIAHMEDGTRLEYAEHLLSEGEKRTEGRFEPINKERQRFIIEELASVLCH